MSELQLNELISRSFPSNIVGIIGITYTMRSPSHRLHQISLLTHGWN